jgi:hypothetical protein
MAGVSWALYLILGCRRTEDAALYHHTRRTLKLWWRPPGCPNNFETVKHGDTRAKQRDTVSV